MNWIFCFIFLIGLLKIDATQSEYDEIKSIPGNCKKLDFKHYSGYLKTKAFYYFATSSSSPSKDPLILFTSGTEGCSFLYDAFNNNGPFIVGNDLHLSLNKNRWNKRANLLYIETDGSIGFSKVASKKVNDNTTSWQLEEGLISFYQKYPKFKVNPLYLVGREKAGYYLVDLSLRIFENPKLKTAPLKGLLALNPKANQVFTKTQQVHMAHSYNFIGKSDYQAILENCCESTSFIECYFDVEKANNECRRLLKSAEINERLFNKYNVFDKCFINAKTYSASQQCNAYHNVEVYFNFGLVQKALNVEKQLWYGCNKKNSYEPYYIYYTGRGDLQNLKKFGKPRNFKFAVVTGEYDYECPSDATFHYYYSNFFVDRMSSTETIKSSDNIMGYKYHWDFVDFYAINKGGHYIEVDQPRITNKILDDFLQQN